MRPIAPPPMRRSPNAGGRSSRALRTGLWASAWACIRRPPRRAGKSWRCSVPPRVSGPPVSSTCATPATRAWRRLKDATYKPLDTLRFWGRLAQRLDSVAGIRAAGVGTDLPWTGYDDNIGGFTIEGKKPPANQEFHARFHVASPGYFRAMGIPLVRGRFFSAGDN